MIFKQNSNDSAKYGSCSCWPQKHSKAVTIIVTMYATFLSYKCIVEFDTSNYINTSSVCFPDERTVACRIDDYLSVYYVHVAALFTGLTIDNTIFLCIA